MNIYEIITNRILDQMKSGIIPWERPWTTGHSDLAISYETRRPYSFLNQMLLGRPGEWLTKSQIDALGGKIKKGCKAGLVTFFKPIPKKVVETVTNEDGVEVEKETTKMSFVLRYYYVFHISDCEGIKSKVEEKPLEKKDPITAAEAVIGEYLDRESSLRFESRQSSKAYYSPSLDEVVVPLLDQFNTVEQYYATTFHEMVHSTGHHSRLDRKAGMGSFFGSKDYSKEELIAEIGSAMLLNKLGIETKKTMDNTTAYLQNWIEVLANDSRMIVYAASGAEKAAKYILNEQ